MLKRISTHCEGLVKGLLFDCRRCGQCVLTSTRLTCPMTCPKQLRNGPCGGTTCGKCEVHGDRACVWVKIQGKRHGERVECPPQLPAVDPTLKDTPSYWNLLTGADKAGRTPLQPNWPLLDVASPECRTASRLERALRDGAFVATTELRAPRGADTRKVRDLALMLRDDFDAINTTAFLNGAPSLPPAALTQSLHGSGVEVVAQATGRDHSRCSFGGELVALRHAQCRNLLCLTGDWASDPQASRQSFEMDSSLMLLKAREAQEALPFEQGIFLGCAINPFSTPWQVPIRRLLQKAAAGAEFVQTQLVCDDAAFASYAERCAEHGLSQRLFQLAGIPLVTSRRALQFLPKVPGVQVPPGFIEELERYDDIAAAGVDKACASIERLRELPGIHGAHLMLFGNDHEALLRVKRQAFPVQETHPKEHAA